MYRRLSIIVSLIVLLSSNAYSTNIQKELIDSIDKNEVKNVEKLIEKGAEINKPDKYGFTPLIWAVSNENIEIINMLLEQGANINFVNKDGGSALWYAVTNQRVKALELLLSKGADPNVKFMDVQTPFEYAKEREWGEFPKILSILTKAGVK